MKNSVFACLLLVFAHILHGSAERVVLWECVPPLFHTLYVGVVGSPIHNVLGLWKCSSLISTRSLVQILLYWYKCLLVEITRVISYWIGTC